jgi:dipeptide/tripeptide permease
MGFGFAGRAGADRKSYLILIFIPLVNYVIYPLINSVFPLTPLRKIGIGLFITALSLLLSFGSKGGSTRG